MLRYFEKIFGKNLIFFSVSLVRDLYRNLFIQIPTAKYFQNNIKYYKQNYTLSTSGQITGGGGYLPVQPVL